MEFGTPMASFSFPFLRQKSSPAAIPNLPPTIGEVRFASRCLNYLSACGWQNISDEFTVNPLLKKGEDRVRTSFIGPEQSIGLARFKDWSLLRASSTVPVMVVIYFPPDNTSVHFAADLNIGLLYYRELHRFSEAIRLAS